LFFRQVPELAAGDFQDEARIHLPFAIIGSDVVSVIELRLIAHSSRLFLIAPAILYYPVKPAVEPRCRLPLMVEGKCSFASVLDEIVRIDDRSRQPDGEAPEPWVEKHQGTAHGFIDHSFSIPDRMPF